MMDISIPYYEDMSRISNSNIGWFLKNGPKFLYDKLTGKGEEETGSQLERGTMIHEYILQPEIFYDDYAVYDGAKPSSDQQKKFCEELINTVEIEYNKAILSAYDASYSIVGKTEDKRLSEGLKIASTLKDYISFTRTLGKKKMISPYDLKMLQDIHKNIFEHKLASKLIKGDGFEVHHEFHINWECRIMYIPKEWKLPEEVTVKCKSLLDHVAFNFEKKTCILADLKTTVNIGHFEDSVEHYDYRRQLAYYLMAIKWYLQNECNCSVDEWTFKVYIIAVDTTGNHEIRVFRLPDIEDGNLAVLHEIYNALEEISWHQYTNKWDHHIDYYINDGSEFLKKPKPEQY